MTNEGEGAGIAGGVFLSGKRAVLVMENSGLARGRPSTSPRWAWGAGIPVVMIMSYRGELGENNWWAIPHGITMEPFSARSASLPVVREVDEIEQAIVNAYETAYASYYHVAIVLGGGIVR